MRHSLRRLLFSEVRHDPPNPLRNPRPSHDRLAATFSRVHVMSEHSVIYLSSSNYPEREWCREDVWKESVRYNLGTDFDALQSTIAQLQARIGDLESGIDERVEAVRFARELISTAFDGGSFDGGEIQDMAVKHGLMRIERREVECGEVCACREYGFPSDCYRTNACLDTINTPKPAEWHDVAGDDEGLVS